MRANYIGGHIDDSYKFDAELIENMIYQMKKGKAADLDGITIEHLYYSSGILPCILSNLCMTAGHVPPSFGKSYTVPILKNKNSIHCKSMTFVAYRLVRPYTRYSSIVYYTGIAISFKTSDNQFGFKHTR